jgi:uncharacterized membrane protein required for colicin V production
MTGYDAAMAVVVILGMIRGAWRGFTWQVASIASLILGYAAAHAGSAQLASHLPGEPEVQRVLAMGLIYVAVSGGIFALAWMIRGTIRKLKFEAYDRHLGTLLGGIEGVGVGMLATLFLVSLAPALRQPVFSSPTGHLVGEVMNNLGPVLPPEVRQVLAPHWEGDGSATDAMAHRKVAENPDAAGEQSQASAIAPSPAPLPAVDEAPASSTPSPSLADLPILPPLEIPPGNDPGVQPAQALAKDLQKLGNRVQKAPAQISNRLKKGEQRIGQAIGEAISSGKDQIETAIDDVIDDQFHPSGNLEPAPRKGPK